MSTPDCLRAIETWLQREEDELLYEPDAGHEAIPAGEPRFGAAIIHRKTGELLLAIGTTPEHWEYEGITYQPCAVFEYDIRSSLIRRSSRMRQRIPPDYTLGIDRVAGEPLAAIFDTLVSYDYICKVVGQDGPWTISITHDIVCIAIQEDTILFTLSPLKRMGTRT